MSKYQREKGKRGEREVCTILRKHGVPAKRISMNETNHEDKGDVSVAEIWIGEVKIGMQVPKFVYDARKTDETEFLFMKRDREKWLVTMDLEWFLNTFIVVQEEEDDED